MVGDAVARPAEGDGAVGQGVLAGGRLLVVDDLLGGGLADVDDGRAVEVPGPELGRAEGVTHGRPPSASRRVEPGEELAEQVAELLLAVGRQAGPQRAGRRGPSVGAGGTGDAAGVGHAVPPVSAVALPAPRGQFEQRGGTNGNAPDRLCPIMRFRCSMTGTPPTGHSTASGCR